MSTRPCPECRRPAPTRDNPSRPFCSERCKLQDLSRWLGGAYVISTPLGPQPPPEPDENDA